MNGNGAAGLPARFWAKTRVEDRGYATPCIIWTAFKTTAGYGRIGWQGKSVYAHRLAYEVLVGPIPEGLELHLLAEVGVYVDKTGKRMCRECIRIRNKRNYRKRQDVVKNETKAA